MNALRPTLLKDIVGQREVISRLRILVDAANKRGEALGHTLFDGPPGLGKTTFSTALQNELGTDLQIANGANLRSVKSLLPYLMRLKPKSILFIDEIHRCPLIVQEFLYPVMEDFRCDLGKDANMTINIEPFTLIGATTNAGMLSQPVQDRFPNKFTLEVYGDSDLALLMAKNASKLGIKLTVEGCKTLAKASRGTPRVANNLLSWCRDYADAKGEQYITHEIVLTALGLAGVSDDGMNANDNKYLRVLKSSFEPMGLKTMAAMTNIDQDTIANNIEPFLFRLGKIRKTPRGRVAV